MAENQVRFDVTGAGLIQAVDNGNPATAEPFQAKERKAFNGLALLIVRSKQGTPGQISVKATADNLAETKAALTAR